MLLHYFLQPPRLVLWFLLLSAAYVHFRGRVRLKFRRQVTDHSTVTAPYNFLVYLSSKASRGPFMDPAEFPALKVLTENWQVFREEGVRLMDEDRIARAIRENDLGFHTFFKRGWKRFYLKWYGNDLPSARVHCPKSFEILSQIPSVHGAMFATLPPGGKLGKHRDPFAGSLRYHLGLRTPNDDACWIAVDGEKRSWRDGQPLVFDETFVHEAYNGSDMTRLILFCDFERPVRRPMTAVNRWMIHHVMKATGTQNEEGEHVGAINRLYSRLSGLIASGKALKAKNKPLYYLVKNASLLLLLAVFLAPWP
jgi:beta-hydroxylase